MCVCVCVCVCVNERKSKNEFNKYDEKNKRKKNIYFGVDENLSYLLWRIFFLYNSFFPKIQNICPEDDFLAWVNNILSIIIILFLFLFLK